MSPPAFVCPRCRGSLNQSATGYSCAACAADYPIISGIPDFRVFPDPWIGIKEDRAKALRLDAATRGFDFEASVNAYWAMTPDTPRELADRYVRHVVGALARSREWVASFPDSPGKRWIEVGCGTGDFLAAAAERNMSVVGADIAMRWLVIARRRPELRDGRIPLVCCCAEALPFAEGAFDRVASLGLLEHCAEPLPVLREARRVLARAGGIQLRTVNRYSLLPEPHVRVWGVGLLPRRYADRYVRWRANLRYQHHRPLSPAELRAALVSAGFDRVRVRAARVLQEERANLGRVGKALVPLYAAARRVPLARTALSWVAPLLEASAVAR
jgi:ubiquinone/menaquinone biosynthesis C-methylase UbiE